LETVKKVKNSATCSGGYPIMSELLIACALKKEERGLRGKLTNRSQFLVTGLGVDRTLRTLERTFEEWKPSCLVFTGMAGQLDPAVELGDVILPEEWQLESGTRFSVDRGLVELLRSSGWEVAGSGVTVSIPVVSRKKRLRLYEKTGARVCDMESAAAMMIAASYEIPCLAPKVVSDTADSGLLAFHRHFDRNIQILGDYLDRLVKTLEELPQISDPI
jgi:nucleoside phosphorylase